MTKINKKGMEGAIALFGALGLAVLLFGIMGIYTSVTAKINTDVGASVSPVSCPSGYTLNSTTNPQCLNSSGGYDGINRIWTIANNVSYNSGTGITNLAQNAPLMGTVLGIAAVLSIIGLIGYGGYQMYKGR